MVYVYDVIKARAIMMKITFNKPFLIKVYGQYGE